jgi:hypothetical protein
MQWKKKGLVYAPDARMPWASNSALTPTPMLIDDDVIRVYAGFRDDCGVSRIGYVDLAASDPSRVLAVSERPVIDVGRPGTFDDNGVILGDVLRHGDEIRMYYVGFQLVDKVKFLAFTGLAVSRDEGRTFDRVYEAPVMDRSDEGLYIRAIHTAMFDEGRWKFWYGVGSDWSYIGGTPYPSYKTRYIESSDGLTFGRDGALCIDFVGDEYRIGRPRVQKVGDTYRMYYTVGTLRGTYLPGYAESPDGIHWTRMDDAVGIAPSTDGWDSRALSYTAPLTWRDREYLFYNGNDMGRSGFGFAERPI